MTLLCLSWPRDATTSWSVERGKECWTTGAWTLSTLPTGLPASPSLHLFAKRRITQSRHKGEQLAESNKRKPATVLYHAFKDKGDGQFNDERLSTINTYYISSHLLRLKLAKAYLVAWFTVGPGNSVHSSPREARHPRVCTKFREIFQQIRGLVLATAIGLGPQDDYPRMTKLMMLVQQTSRLHCALPARDRLATGCVPSSASLHCSEPQTA